MEKKIIGHIYETMNYEQFEIINGNRKIDHAKKIGHSIDKNGALLSPIIVNEKMQIIDGQNRFVALRERNLPVKYIIAEGYGIEQVRALNEGAKNWTLINHIKSHADAGNEACQRLMSFINRHKGINYSALFEIAFGRNISKGEMANLDQFTFDNEKFAEKVVTYMEKLKEVDLNDKPIYKRREFSRAMCQVAKVEGFDIETLICKIRLDPRKFVQCGSPSQYIDMLEDIYNKRNRHPLHFDF